MKGKNMSYQRNMCVYIHQDRCLEKSRHQLTFICSARCLLAVCLSYNSLDKVLCLPGEPVFITVEKDRQYSNVTECHYVNIQRFTLSKLAKYTRKCKLKSTQE